MTSPVLVRWARRPRHFAIAVASQEGPNLKQYLIVVNGLLSSAPSSPLLYNSSIRRKLLHLVQRLTTFTKQSLYAKL